MSFPRYPKYKDSGVEWLGNVPEHWSVFPINRLVQAERRITYGIVQPGERDENGRFMVRGQDYSFGWAMPDTIFKVSDAVEIPYRRARLMAGDLVITIVGAGVGNVAVVPQWLDGANITQTTARIAVDRTKAIPSFVAAVLQGPMGRRSVELYAKGAAQPGLNLEHVKIFPVTVPPLAEQAAIAAFLDRETAKIDELVAEQRRLMELLKEKRQGVISHAVTRGLNPDARLKPSGIEWLGDVPEHWRVGKCGFYLSILSGFAFPSSGFSEDDSDTKLLRGINVGVSRLKWDETVRWRRLPDDGLDVYEMRAGDLVIGMDRPLIGEGMRVAKVKESDLPCLLLQRVASLKPGPLLNADFLVALLSSEMFVAHFAPETTGVSVPHISPEQIYNFVIPLPPVNEQALIVGFVEAEKAKLDTLTAEAQRAIDLLQERRTALISAAVTGQIDVRGLAAPASERLQGEPGVVSSGPKP